MFFFIPEQMDSSSFFSGSIPCRPVNGCPGKNRKGDTSASGATTRLPNYTDMVLRSKLDPPLPASIMIVVEPEIGFKVQVGSNFLSVQTVTAVTVTVPSAIVVNSRPPIRTCEVHESRRQKI